MTEKRPVYLTAEGAEKLKAELRDLKGPQRGALAARLRDAIQMGDLSENADYIKAKEDQAFLEGRIQDLEAILRDATIIAEKDISRERVAVGTRVTVQEDTYDPEEFHMVGAKEADPRAGKISNESPIGAALMGHQVGEEVEAETPGGKIKLKILKIA
ncbi:MAG: transcription elongation factor GreA [Anaerolineales bacterium]|nr:transcription elongation factor GreA [Anaerolineales bacterium]